MAAIVSPSTRTSATERPSAVTTVPFAINVRMGVSLRLFLVSPAQLLMVFE